MPSRNLCSSPQQVVEYRVEPVLPGVAKDDDRVSLVEKTHYYPTEKK